MESRWLNWSSTVIHSTHFVLTARPVTLISRGLQDVEVLKKMQSRLPLSPISWNRSPLLGVYTLKIWGKRKETNDVPIFYPYHSHRIISHPTDIYTQENYAAVLSPLLPRQVTFPSHGYISVSQTVRLLRWWWADCFHTHYCWRSGTEDQSSRYHRLWT